jgi:hypothetical protein
MPNKINPLTGKFDYYETGSEVTTTTLQDVIEGAVEQTSPSGDDLIAITDSTGSSVKKLSWTNLKSLLKTYFDTIYTTTSAVASQITTALASYITTSTADANYSSKNITANRQTASYVAVAGDNGKIIEMNVGSANTLTINNNVFSAGNQLLVSQYGAGQTTITAGAGVTFRGTKLKTNAQYSIATIIAVSASEFYVAGDLTT